VKKAPPARGKSDRSDKSARVGSAKGIRDKWLPPTRPAYFTQPAARC